MCPIPSNTSASRAIAAHPGTQADSDDAQDSKAVLLKVVDKIVTKDEPSEWEMPF